MAITISFSLLLIIGLTVAWTRRKEKKWVLLGLGAALLPPVLLAIPGYGGIFLNEIDKSLGRRMELSVETEGYQVSLVQIAGSRSPTTYFRITRADGKIAIVLLPKVTRWWFGRVALADGKATFSGGMGTADDEEYSLDQKHGEILISGKETVRIEDLDYTLMETR